MRIARAQDQRAQRAHLCVEQPDRISLRIVRSEAVRADKLGKLIGVVRGRAFNPAHLGEAHADARLRELPRRLGSGEPAADDMHLMSHRWADSVSSSRGNDKVAVMRLFTIGYEGATQGEVIAALQSAGVEQVIDVRAVPLSRKPGFSKNVLASALKEAGIDYVHLKALGTPPEGREAARKGDHATLERIYAGQLETPEAIAQSAEMLTLAGEKPSALLCFEHDPEKCHRSLLIGAVAKDAEVVNLFA
jgi:hypothetical protein